MLKTTGRCRFAICLINISPAPTHPHPPGLCRNTGISQCVRLVANVILCAITMLACNATRSSPLVLNSGIRQVTLLELYTTQGCSSCPTAERCLNTCSDSDDLWSATVPLAFHVNYWDYLGWRDTLAAQLPWRMPARLYTCQHGPHRLHDGHVRHWP